MAKSITSIHALDLVDKHTFADCAENGDLLFCSSRGSVDDLTDKVAPAMWDHIGMIWVSPDSEGWIVLSNEDGISCDPLAQYIKRGGSLALAHRPALSSRERIGAYLGGLSLLEDPYLLEHTGGYGSSALIHECYRYTIHPLAVKGVPSVDEVWCESSVVVKCGLRR